VFLDVEPIPAVRGEVDPADEGDAAVDHGELLMVTVERSLLRVERDPDAGIPLQRVPHLPRLASVWMEQRERRAAPSQQPDVDATLGRGGEEVAQSLCSIAAKAVIRREVPAGEPDRRLRGLDFARDLPQGFGTVDEHLEAVAGPRRGARGPASGRGVERSGVSDSVEPPAMVCSDGVFEARACRPVEGTGPLRARRRERIGRHRLPLPAWADSESAFLAQ
jgi:hypothetical protein